MSFESRIYDRQGRPISHADWSRLRMKTKYQRVSRTKVRRVTVSTVWLGLDHGFMGGPPVIFETMVFGGHFDQDQERYRTEAEAMAGHARWVELVTNSEAVLAAARAAVDTPG